jgi:hypothetical protein
VAARRRSGDGYWTAWSGVLIVVMLVAGAVAPAAPALADDDWTPRARSVLTAVTPRPAWSATATATAAAPAAAAHAVYAPAEPGSERPRVSLTLTADLHGVLRPTRLAMTGVDLYTDAVVAARLAIAGTAVPAIVANGLRLLAAGSGPLVPARHLQGHLAT